MYNHVIIVSAPSGTPVIDITYSQIEAPPWGSYPCKMVVQPLEE